MAARLQIFADPMTVVAPEAMKQDLIDEFQLADLGSQDIRGLGEMRLLRVTAAPDRQLGRLGPG